MPTKIRLGTCSPETQATTPETIALISRLAHRAAAKGIDILLLPEAFIGGYPRGSSFGCVIGGRTKAGRDEYLRYFQSAVDFGDIVGEAGAGGGTRWVNRELGGDAGGDGTREELERIARETGVFLATGCIERAGGSLYCAAVYVCPRQGTLGKRRKVMPTGSERLVWAQGAPSTLRAVSTTIRGVRINLAAAICWENYMPLVRQALYAQNINLWLAPTADAREAWLALMRTVGIEGRCFVVSANMCVAKQVPPAPAAAAGGSAVTGGANEEEEDKEEPAPYDGPRRRRRSVIDEDGNEIVLCAEDQNTEHQSTTQESQQTSPKQTNGNSPVRKHGRRRSVFDPDGNEIVLCKDEHKSSARTQAQQQDGAKEYLSRGGSCIVDPYGDVLAGPQWEDSDEIIYADVDFDDCIRGRLDLDVGGSYSRNDSFKFAVNGLDLSPLPY